MYFPKDCANKVGADLTCKQYIYKFTCYGKKKKLTECREASADIQSFQIQTKICNTVPPFQSLARNVKVKIKT